MEIGPDIRVPLQLLLLWPRQEFAFTVTDTSWVWPLGIGDAVDGLPWMTRFEGEVNVAPAACDGPLLETVTVRVAVDDPSAYKQLGVGGELGGGSAQTGVCDATTTLVT